MKAMFRVWKETTLVIKILIGLVLGALLGIFIPKATFLSVPGDLFVGALKEIAPLLVFVLVISSLANAAGDIGKRFTTVIILYMASTLIASSIAVVAGYLFPVTIELTDYAAEAVPPGGLQDILHSILSNLVQNPVAAIGSANYVGVLAWAVLLGLAFKTFAFRSTPFLSSDFSSSFSQSPVNRKLFLS